MVQIIDGGMVQIIDGGMLHIAGGGMAPYMAVRYSGWRYGIADGGTV